ncbi:AAA family ATPase [Streptomyces mobaraensis NBRC 13819 = DSM 40847]|uniref:ATPase-like protein n=1 Tax=Streptomyces mobaraensis (strain ATCC 29032 / DSM 40847 / JCM 4168 / NBRC 13819 / NCIMB 11159 / IPCR 16-22) TaxID=1223523 RepID=M3BCN6_STRM1|nr:AAA family ATPase [Streptomyces mobaraensis]EME97319.1 ATPase-like protein [Streptomyces mobaraensis NBRC 13819 = DSM 40847]QTT75717.1 AAA family ATPase [Streptomyces mobaraensis NBRC 13819 = DSM 40847]
MPSRLLELHVENFRSLRDVTVPLGPLTVLVGPNGVGKSNVLKVFDFLADIIRTDLQPALDVRGGFDEVAFWGGVKPPTFMRVQLKATWTSNSTLNAPDQYSLTIRRRSLPANRDSSRAAYTLSREESFVFKRTQGRGRRITISGEEARVVDRRAGKEEGGGRFGIRRLSSGLSTLPRLGPADGGDEVTRVAERLSSFRVFDVDVAAARMPTRLRAADMDTLASHAENLAAFLINLSGREEIWENLVEDARRVLPQLESIEFEEAGGSTDQLTVVLRERGLRRLTPLADASYGTVRLLGLLALLYDPHPPAFTCIEEIDHGLHPQALELIVERLREASERTQLIVATHSPALVNRLRPDEFVVCDRDDGGASVIPALTATEVEEIVEESGDQPLGELWFAGVLGGDLTGGAL